MGIATDYNPLLLTANTRQLCTQQRDCCSQDNQAGAWVYYIRAWQQTLTLFRCRVNNGRVLIVPRSIVSCIRSRCALCPLAPALRGVWLHNYDTISLSAAQHTVPYNGESRIIQRNYSYIAGWLAIGWLAIALAKACA